MPCIKKFTLDQIEKLSIFKQNPKLLLKLKINTNEDNFYETHQLYKTIHFRCMNLDLIDEALDLIFNGLVYFLNKNQLHCLLDLSKVFVETLKKSSINFLSEDLLDRIKTIHYSLRDGAEERNEFTVNILKWSGSLFANKVNQKQTSSDNKNSSEANLNVYQKTFGHVNIHKEFAFNFWEEKNYIQARYHFLHSQDGISFANMIIECQINYGFPSEIDLFLCQCVLQYLCLRNLETAMQFYDAYIKNHPIFKDKPEQVNNIPIINFLKFLFVSIKSEKVKWFKALIEIYKPSLQRDESFNEYLERIGQYFFNLKPTKVERESILNNLFRMLTNSNEISTSSQLNSINDQSGDNSNTEDEFNSLREDDIEDNDLLD